MRKIRGLTTHTLALLLGGKEFLQRSSAIIRALRPTRHSTSINNLSDSKRCEIEPAMVVFGIARDLFFKLFERLLAAACKIGNA